MADPRRVDFTLADRRRLTVVEIARACAAADVGPQDADGMFARLVKGQGTGDEFLRAVTLTTAFAWQLAKRDEPDLTLDDALAWDLHVIVGEPDRVQDAEAALTVAAAVATGLSPREAGQLTAAELDEYGTHWRTRSTVGR